MSVATGLALGIGVMAGSAMSSSGGSNYSAPAPLDPSTLGSNSLASQIQLMPQQLAADQQYGGQFTSLNTSLLGQALTGDSTMGQGGLVGMYNQISPLLGATQAASNTQARTSNINDVQNLGLTATQAYQAANPLLTTQMKALAGDINGAGVMGAVNFNNVTPQQGQANLAQASQAQLNQASLTQSQLAQANASQANLSQAQLTQSQLAQGNLTQSRLAQANGGPLLGQLSGNASQSLGQLTPLEQMEQQQAARLLATNGGLTAAQTAQAQDSARAAYADRGLLNSNSGIGAEVLSTADATQARLLQNQSLAQSVDAATNAQTNATRSYALGVQSQGQNLSQYNATAANSTGQFNAAAANSMGQFNAGAMNANSQFNTAAANQLGMFNANNANQLGLANAQMLNQVGMYNTSAANANNQFNANAANQLGMFNATNANQLGLANSQMANQVGMFNAGSGNQMTLANAQMGNQVGMYNASSDFSAGVTNAQSALQQQQQAINNQGTLANMYQSQSIDPFSLVLGQGNGVGQAMSAAGQGSQYANSNTVDPWNSTIMSMYNTNYNGQNAANIAAGNDNAAMMGSGMGAIGSLGRAAIAAGMFCWVAREVFGAESDRWRSFRTWLLTRAPAEFLSLYQRRGERFARLISTRPQLRAAVRSWMENIIAHDGEFAYGL